MLTTNAPISRRGISFAWEGDGSANDTTSKKRNLERGDDLPAILLLGRRILVAFFDGDDKAGMVVVSITPTDLNFHNYVARSDVLTPPYSVDERSYGFVRIVMLQK
jgi:hypothetical protein